MNHYELPIFGKINLDQVEDYMVKDIMLDGRDISIDLNFDNLKVKESLVTPLVDFIDKLHVHMDAALLKIREDFIAGGEVLEYIEHHTEEVEADEMDALLKNADKNLSKEKQLLSVLHLKRIGLYPDSDSNFSTYDFTLGQDFTNYLIVVNMDKDGTIREIVMES